MDFDEYEYLEKSVEELEAARSKKKQGQLSDDKRESGRGDDKERKSKKSRGAEDENGGQRKREETERFERRREKEERSRGDRDRGRGGDGVRERDRERRDRESEKERSRPSRTREPEKDREGELRDKDKDKEKEREKERSGRSSSRSRRQGSLELEKDRKVESRDRDKERERVRKERDNDGERERERSERGRQHGRWELEKDKDKESGLRDMEMRDNRRFKDRKEAETEADPERDQRTVFAYQMPLKAVERDAYEFFSKAGKVRDVRLIMDRSSRRSKGVGYIEFYDAMSVPMAIALSGQLLLGQPVMVKPSEAEKNLIQPTPATSSSVSGPYGPTDRKLYVGNLHFNMTEQQLRQIFEPFGPVELIQLPLDLETGHCKGFGFVQFAQVEHAKAAVVLNGKLEIAGRYIKVSSVSEHVGGQDAGTNAADFDDDDGGGLSLNAQSRALLMQKLDRTGVASSIAGSLGVTTQQPFALPFNGQAAIPSLPGQVLPVPVAEFIGNPSDCVLLKNLFDPATETDLEFDLDIKEDVGEECSKFGRVRHIYVDRHSDGHVYLRFDNKEGAMNAQRGMHMRWFARRLISAIFLPPQDYERKFPDVAW